MTRLIDADVVIKHIEEYWEMVKGGNPSRGMTTVMQNIKTIVNSLPTVDAEPVRHGKWEYGEDESGYDGYYCSKCFGHVRWYGKAGKQSINFIKKYNYCPNCGARMDVE